MEARTAKISCHCKRVRAEVKIRRPNIKLWDCNCSDCKLRKNLHFIVPATDFTLLTHPSEQTLYLWGTKTAKRPFCKTCGILPYYIPRSNPDGVAVTQHCVLWDDFDGVKPTFQVCTYDGQNWEKSHAETNISKESK
eukprot:snap_masked-scaffold_6-processed-gene-13.16-mRNA-1 protein AED:0.03 eAED:0.03 QI:0/-1/0/1/-1/1/1/0/136